MDLQFHHTTNRGARTMQCVAVTQQRTRPPKRPPEPGDPHAEDDVPQPKWTRAQKAEGVYDTKGCGASRCDDGRVPIAPAADPWPSTSGQRLAAASAVGSYACGTGGSTSSSSSGGGSSACPSCGCAFRPFHLRRVREGSEWRGIQGGVMICARCYFSCSSGRQ